MARIEAEKQEGEELSALETLTQASCRRYDCNIVQVTAREHRHMTGLTQFRT